MDNEHVNTVKISDWAKRWAFVRLDQFTEIEKMTVDMMDELNNLCKYASAIHGWGHYINSSYRIQGTGQHTKGRAVDLVLYRSRLGDIDVLSQFIFALRFRFNGVGFYPYWSTPGIHIDTRQDTDFRALWFQDKDKKYKDVNEYFKQLKSRE